MPIETIANFAEIIGAFTILTAMGFGMKQIHMHKVQEKNNFAAELTRTFMDETLSLSVARLRTVPDGVTAEELRAMGPDFEEAAIRVTMSFETMGLMVYRGFASKSLAFDLAGGIMGVMWRKLHVWQATMRDEQGQPSWAEWFEWLALQTYAVKGTTPLGTADVVDLAPLKERSQQRAVVLK